MRWIAGIAFALILLLVAGSFLPVIEGESAFLRWWDFPRVQIGFLLIVLLAVHLIASTGEVLRIVSTVLVLAALGYHGSKLLPFTSAAPVMALSTDICPEGTGLRILSFNAQRSNEAGEAFLDLVARVEPDLLLVMETDEYWDGVLARLSATYPDGASHIPEEAEFYGMHLLSRLPLVAPKVVMRPEAGTPSIVTGVVLPSGDRVRFQGVHPRPPIPFRQGTTLRDATLYRAALDAAGSSRPTILAGDFNAVPWSGVIASVMRLGGLLEPRIGRGLVPTYGAESWWKSWPLDYVLYQDAFALRQFGRLPPVGSDHRPVLADLCLQPDMAERQVIPAATREDLREAERTVAAAERLRREN